MTTGWNIPSVARKIAVDEYNVIAAQYNKLAPQMGLCEMPTGDPSHMSITLLRHQTLTLKALLKEVVQKGTK